MTICMPNDIIIRIIFLIEEILLGERKIEGMSSLHCQSFK
jgi:hypothetical protein